MKVEWTAQALAELSAIATHISKESPTGAFRVHSQIVHSVSFLEEWPAMGKRARRGYRELIVPHTPYVVLYRSERKLVTIKRVLHQSARR